MNLNYHISNFICKADVLMTTTNKCMADRKSKKCREEKEREEKGREGKRRGGEGRAVKSIPHL